MRECIDILVRGLHLRGTVHMPPGRASHAPTGFEDLGVIMLHPGHEPRSGTGDIAVAIADSLAREGIVAVRLDAPGLGDSEGELHEDALMFAQAVQQGGFAPVTCECVDHMRRRLGLRRVVLGGYCGGAVTALFAVASRPDDRPVGVFALETMFHLVREQGQDGKNTDRATAATERDLRREALRAEMRVALLSNRLGGLLQKFVQGARGLRRRARQSSRQAPAQKRAPPQSPPPDANVGLFECINRILESDVRLLFVSAEDPRRASKFDYLAYLLPGEHPRVRQQEIAGTDHGFLGGNGKARIVELVTRWVANEFRAPRQQAVSQALSEDDRP